MEDRRARIAAAQRQIASVVDSGPKPRRQTGAAPIDAALQGGLILGALHEVAAADHRATPAALGFLLMLAALAAGPEGALLWPLPPHGTEFGYPYAPGLGRCGLAAERVLFLRCRRSEEALWAMEEALRLGGVAAVIGCRPPGMDLTQSRRLQLAAETASIPVFLLRPWRDDALSAAVTRWRVAPAPSGEDRFGFMGPARFAVTLEKARGGRGGQWLVEFDHDAVCLRLPALLQHRAAEAARA